MTDTLIDPAVLHEETPNPAGKLKIAGGRRSGAGAPAGLRLPVDGSRELDVISELLAGQDYFAGMDRLVKHLREVRLASSDDAWDAFVSSRLLAHPIRSLVHRDPFTRRSFEKPRGFAGDAVLLDYIYGCTDTARPPDPASEPVAHGIFSYTVNAPAPKAVRYRRSLIARLVDETAERFPEARVLSLACGHLREAELSGALQGGEISEWCAADQDRECIDFVGRRLASRPCVRPFPASIREIVSGRSTFSGYHLVYASGLFDYLEERAATGLVERMFEATVPGGSVLVTNFLPAVHDVGYMESFMAWRLIFRTESDLLGLFSSIPRSQIQRIEIKVDPDENIAFAIARKR